MSSIDRTAIAEPVRPPPPELEAMPGFARTCCAALPMFVGFILAAADLAAQLPVPGAPCSPHGTAVVRLRLVDPRGQVPEAPANAVIVALRCGAMVDSLGIAELRALPEGRHLVQVRAVGFPPESVAVAVTPGDTVRATVQLRPAAAVRADAPAAPGPH